MIFIMPLDSLFALVGLTIATAITPGPNNAMVAASGACFGYRRTIPHILGISLGFGFMIFCVGAFLGEIFQQSWLLREGLRWVGVGLLIYVAWRTATTHRIGSQDAGRKPFTFLQAAAFQWLNPKGLGDVNRSHIAVYFDRVPDAKCASSGVGFQPGRDLHRLELDGAGSGDWSTVRGPVAINLVQPDYGVDDLGLCGIFILRLIRLTEPRLAGNICFYLSVLYNYR